MESAIEQTLTVITRCFIYRIPPAKTMAGHNAMEWGLDNPLNKATQLKVKVIEYGEKCLIRVEEYDTNQLFLETSYLRGSVEKVLDSSRYFVMRVVDPSRPDTHAFIGIGFQDRDEAFEFENALRTHDKYAQRQAEIEKQNAERAANHQDLSLKNGQTIQVNLKADHQRAQQKREPRTTGGLAFNFADPSSGGGFFAAPSSGPAANAAPAPAAAAAPSQGDWFSSLPAAPSAPGAGSTTSASNSFDFFSLPLVPSTSATNSSTVPSKTSSNEDWSDFSTGASKNAANDSWANF